MSTTYELTAAAALRTGDLIQHDALERLVARVAQSHDGEVMLELWQRGASEYELLFLRANQLVRRAAMQRSAA